VAAILRTIERQKMLIKVGFDFGTTTSILSYLEGDELKAFYYGGVTGGGTPYVPSVVAYSPSGLFIGHAAIDEMLFEQASLYRFFKMLLPEEQNENWLDTYGPYATGEMTPAQVSADFIGELINGTSPGREVQSLARAAQKSFRQASGHEVEELVVSVPQVWREVSAHGRQQLQTLVRDLGLPLKQLISEPVAAAAYFTHLYLKRQDKPYYGNLLICDMGGGTFDVTLCRLSENRVDVIYNDGNGERGLGIAGAHFDSSLLVNKLGPGISPDVLYEFLVKFDNEKKTHKVGARRLITYSLASQEEHPVPIYAVSTAKTGGLNFSFDEVCAAFAPVREGIFKVLDKVRRETQRRGHAIDKVVLVGGFSRFPLVQLSVIDFFGESYDNLKLIDLNTFDDDDMAFAISFGACLVANNLVQVSENYEYTVSLIVTNASGDDEEVELITAGKSLDTLDMPNFCCWPDGRRRRFLTKRDAIEAEVVIRPSRDGAAGERWVRQLSLSEVPNIDVPCNHWFFGARVDHSQIPYLIVEDENCGEKKEYPLGDLIPDMSAGTA
jgi:molecular chaperone DnaK